MSHPAITVEGLGKEYAIGAAQQLPGTLYDLLTGLLKGRREHSLVEAPARADTSFWALRDLDFEIKAGEVFGIVGRNGAGKSTLLKILSRITAPTRGRVTIHGRIASLLEVGTGFHPELTGRENIYLNATILGMSQKEIARQFDAIVEFSGVARFLDTPVKRYSSGMYVRLAFAVAAHVEADILLIDEVLAVGDADFQKRCLGMMGDVARGGRTVLFVSHNLTALRNLCTTGLLLNEGRIEARGHIDDVLNRYASARATEGDMAVELPPAPADQVASLRRLAVLAQGANADGPISVRTPFDITVELDVRRPDVDIGVYLHCHDGSQNRVFSTGSFFNPALNGVALDSGRYRFACEIPADLLNEGEYTLDVMLVRDRSEVLATESSILSFRVHGAPTGIEGWNWPILGVIRPQLQWSCARSPIASPSGATAETI
jgi:lipopolysaccharide transport system ATP-binding protein